MSTTTDPRDYLDTVREMLDLCGALPLKEAVSILRERTGLAYGVACDAVRHAVNVRAIKTLRTDAGEWKVAR